MSITPTFDLELLRSFVAVATHGTFASAGSRLQRSQSAVTQQMQRLEAQLGQTLFEKQGRGKRLTEHGHHLLRYARDMLALNDDAMLALRDSGSGGSLRIGSPHDIADTILPQVLSHIARFMPDLRLEIEVGRSPQLMEALHRGVVDITISTREDATLEGFVLRSSPTLWLCAAQFVPVPQQPVPLILGDEPSIFRRYALEALERHRIPWRQAYTSSSPTGIKAALRAGLGVTARSMDLLGGDMRVLGEKDGFPRLPDISYYLWVRPGSVNPLVRQAYALLKSGQGREAAERRATAGGRRKDQAR